MKSSISVVLPILAPTPFLRALAEFSIKTLRLHADNEFELVVVEAQERYFEQYALAVGGQPSVGIGLEVFHPLRIDNYLGFVPPIGGVKEINAGIRAARGEFIVVTGTDVLVPPHWDTELLRVFEERPKDAGIATLVAKEPGVFIGPRDPMPMLVEGMFSPFSMFRRGWEYDEAYLRVYQDSDLVMRMYESGLRAFRNLHAAVWHLGQVSNDGADEAFRAAHARALAQDETLFYQRWGSSPLAMFAMTRYGQQSYGREHEAWTAPIHRHTVQT